MENIKNPRKLKGNSINYIMTKFSKMRRSSIKLWNERPRRVHPGRTKL